MTAKAPPHIHAHGRARNGHLPDIPVAGLAAHTGKHMWLVAKENVIRHLNDPLPGYRFLPLPVTEHGLHFTPIRGDDLVTSDTALNGRNAGHIRPHGIGMAEEALDPCFIVEVVTKRHGLAGRGQCGTFTDEDCRGDDNERSNDCQKPPEPKEA